MAATLTAGTYPTQNPRTLHEGTWTQYFKYEANGTSVSAGDTILLGHIPAGVTVVDGFIWGAFGSSGATIRLGNTTSTTAISTAITLTGAGVNRISGPPRTFSLSADAEGLLRVPIAAVVAAGTSTTTGSLNVVLIMQSDPIL